MENCNNKKVNFNLNDRIVKLDKFVRIISDEIISVRIEINKLIVESGCSDDVKERVIELEDELFELESKKFEMIKFMNSLISSCSLATKI